MRINILCKDFVLLLQAIVFRTEILDIANYISKQNEHEKDRYIGLRFFFFLKDTNGAFRLQFCHLNGKNTALKRINRVSNLSH